MNNVIDYVKGIFYPPVVVEEDYSWFKPETKVYSSGYLYNGDGRINISSHPVFGHDNILKSIELYRNYWHDLIHRKKVVIVCNCIRDCTCGKRQNFINLMKDFGCDYCGELH